MVVVIVISPAEGLYAVPLNITAFGVPKLARFSTLKTSARNCNEALSEIADARRPSVTYLTTFGYPSSHG